MSLEHKLQNLLGQFLFEENNDITRGNIQRGLSSYLSGMVVRREIKSFDISFDTFRSTDEQIFIDVQIVPISKIEKIQVNLNLSKMP